MKVKSNTDFGRSLALTAAILVPFALVVTGLILIVTAAVRISKIVVSTAAGLGSVAEAMAEEGAANGVEAAPSRYEIRQTGCAIEPAGPTFTAEITSTSFDDRVYYVDVDFVTDNQFLGSSGTSEEITVLAGDTVAFTVVDEFYEGTGSLATGELRCNVSSVHY
ncbi:MAG: hypothetical protein M5U31_09850 [Acidimicrobiia bacterium]|nr:hypothetical protein [Acidimicrobiia bacterium]